MGSASRDGIQDYGQESSAKGVTSACQFAWVPAPASQSSKRWSLVGDVRYAVLGAAGHLHQQDVNPQPWAGLVPNKGVHWTVAHKRIRGFVTRREV